MTPRDDLRPPTAPSPSALSDDRWTDREIPEPPLLSTIWEGPTNTESPIDERLAATAVRYRPTPNRRQSTWSRILDWMLEPATRRRVLMVTTLAALACAGGVTLLEMYGGSVPLAQSPPPGAAEPSPAGAGPVGLSSQAIEIDGPAEVDSSPGPAIRQSISADETLRLTVESLETGAGSWMVQAELLDPGVDQQPESTTGHPVVQFTVDGVVVEEVTQPPYRLMLNPEATESMSSWVDGRRPQLVVTAVALWPTGDQAAGPATVIVQN